MTLEEVAQAVADTIQARFDAIGFDAPDSLKIVGDGAEGTPEVVVEAADGIVYRIVVLG